MESGIYGIKSITMDTGAGYTIFPEDFAKHLDILKPTGDKAEYYRKTKSSVSEANIFSGVGGMSVCFLSPGFLIVGIEDKDGNKVKETITPFFLTSYAPSITSEGQLLARPEYQPHTERIIDFISPPFQYCDDYTVKVSSPYQTFSFRKRKSLV